jgi:hypothetical protein
VRDRISVPIFMRVAHKLGEMELTVKRRRSNTHRLYRAITKVQTPVAVIGVPSGVRGQNKALLFLHQ